MNPVASVLMSVYNGGEYLSSSIESILNQTMGDFEFIIIDDGSSDDTWDILQGYQDSRIKLHRNFENIGLTRSLNRALEMAAGEYIFRQDADDISVATRLEEQKNYLEQNPHVILVGSAVTLIDESGSRTGEMIYHANHDKSIRWHLLLHNSFFHTSVAIRRNVLSENNLSYRTEIQYAQDFELWSRILKFGEGANIRKPLVSIRLHQDQVTEKNWNHQQKLATRIAADNIAELGLENEFAHEQVWLMRRLDLEWGSMSDDERFEGGKYLRRLLKGFENKNHQYDPQWSLTRRRILKQVHHCMFTNPRNFDEFKTQWKILCLSPREAANDLFVMAIKKFRSAMRDFGQIGVNP